MQEITTKTMALEVRVKEKRRRAQYIRTQDGKKRILQVMLEIFEYLRLSGYKLPQDNPTRMAEIWSEQLSGYIVAYGTDIIKEAVRNFVLNDEREYRQYPNASQIIREAKKIGYDPDSEMARREFENKIERMEREQTEKARNELTPERRKELSERYPSVEAFVKDNF